MAKKKKNQHSKSVDSKVPQYYKDISHIDVENIALPARIKAFNKPEQVYFNTKAFIIDQDRDAISRYCYGIGANIYHANIVGEIPLHPDWRLGDRDLHGIDCIYKITEDFFTVTLIDVPFWSEKVNQTVYKTVTILRITSFHMMMHLFDDVDIFAEHFKT